MKDGTLAPLTKPPPLLLPQKDHAKNLHGRAMSRSIAKYDNFSGILKRVNEMKVSMDTESENSSVRTRSSRSSGMQFGSSSEDPSSPFEDESSASDVTGSDHSPPYEEIPNSVSNRYSCTSVRSAAETSQFLNSFRDSKTLETSPVYSNEPVSHTRLSSCSSQSNIMNNNVEAVRHRVSSLYSNERSRPASLYSNSDTPKPWSNSAYCNGEQGRRPSSLYSNSYEPDYINTTSSTVSYDHTDDSAATDVNENQTTPERADLSEAEIRKIEMFFRGLRNEIWVSTSLVNMYVSKSGQEGSWTFKHTGVPLVVLESGDTKSRSKRRIQIILAERGTSFPLWKDTIDNLSSYRKANQAFHTMHLSSDHQQVIGFSFDCPEEADRILKCIDRLSADPENINICVPGSKKKKSKTKDKKIVHLPTKKQISAPCLFEHVTSVAAKDQPIYMSLKTLIDRGMKKPENIS